MDNYYDLIFEWIRSKSFIRILMAFVLLTWTSWPFIENYLSGEHRKIIDGLKGEDKKWQSVEVWDYHSLRFAKGFFVAFMSLIASRWVISDFAPPWLYIICFAGTLGSNGVGAVLSYLKIKNGIDK